MHNFFWFVLFVAVNGGFLILLTANVSRLRIKNRISYGDGDNRDLMRAIRVHANGTEQVPIFALMVLALAMIGTADMLMGALVILFTLSRLVHAFGVLYKNPMARQYGAAVTYLLQIVAVVMLILALLGSWV
ncbi:MAPEG family protein [Aestuariirhabdus sp. Z084]|uniref:MAPEG family protein n=1 Tax=Aestuariirhabdus haliotis TaxID=2918751 RepID=UPI00201B3E14|nr:MAPEG family protein [Aestuariirhabdus haliotis]MCL6417587.1 MAPEG family protein [Aestuariirhabdus haliotis]MCL6421509.1 MAPEG family protein [Aestuariirhabdus haliotis]